MRSEARPRADSDAQSVQTRPADGPSSLFSPGGQSHVVVPGKGGQVGEDNDAGSRMYRDGNARGGVLARA
jgi:hypothetical protein